MSGLDYEFTKNWDVDEDGNRYVRKRPARLRDREALKALLTTFARFAGSDVFIIDFNDVDYDSRLTFDQLMDVIPPRILRIHLQSDGPGFLVVHLNAKHGGDTWVWGEGIATQGYGSPIQRLAGLVEDNSEDLGWKRVFGRDSAPAWLAKWRPTVVDLAHRDDLAQRAENRRVARIGARWGFIAGIVGGIAGAYATWYLAGAPTTNDLPTP